MQLIHSYYQTLLRMRRVYFEVRDVSVLHVHQHKLVLVGERIKCCIAQQSNYLDEELGANHIYLSSDARGPRSRVAEITFRF